jgi:hypothetical protein
MSASNASGAFLLPDRQPLSPLQSAASTASAASITQPLSLLTGLAARLLRVGKPSAASAAAQLTVAVAPPHPASGRSSSSNASSGAAVQSSRGLAQDDASTAAGDMGVGDAQEPVSSLLSLTEAGKQHTGQLVVSEVSLSFPLQHSKALCCFELGATEAVLCHPAELDVKQMQRPGS